MAWYGVYLDFINRSYPRLLRILMFLTVASLVLMLLVKVGVFDGLETTPDMENRTATTAFPDNATDHLIPKNITGNNVVKGNGTTKPVAVPENNRKPWKLNGMTSPVCTPLNVTPEVLVFNISNGSEVYAINITLNETTPAWLSARGKKRWNSNCTEEYQNMYKDVAVKLAHLSGCYKNEPVESKSLPVWLSRNRASFWNNTKVAYKKLKEVASVFVKKLGVNATRKLYSATVGPKRVQNCSKNGYVPTWLAPFAKNIWLAKNNPVFLSAVCNDIQDRMDRIEGHLKRMFVADHLWSFPAEFWPTLLDYLVVRRDAFVVSSYKVKFPAWLAPSYADLWVATTRTAFNKLAVMERETADEMSKVVTSNDPDRKWTSEVSRAIKN